MNWQRIRGHEKLVEQFHDAVERGRLGHAFLFVGPVGIGKHLFAHELAKTILCENATPKNWQACDRCSACQLVEAGTHPDVIVAGRPEGKNEVPIEVVRELCRALALKSSRGRGKVAILDDADDLNPYSANCFLKTLEEPPAGSVLILIGTSSDLQLPTIVSRCQLVHFKPLPDAVIGELLKAQGVTDSALLERVVRQSGGSPGQALALADPALWDFRKALLQALTRPRFDSVGLARQWLEFVEQAGKESALQRRRASLTLRLLLDLLNDALRLSVDAEPVAANAEEAVSLKKLANALGADQLLEVLNRCLEADTQIDRYVQLVLVIEALADALGQHVGAGAVR
jgi:DNA polymerase-3 subunit delta'